MMLTSFPKRQSRRILRLCAVRKQRRDGLVLSNIPEWTQSKDPDGITWEYWEETKLFHPLKYLIRGFRELFNPLKPLNIVSHTNLIVWSPLKLRIDT